MEHRQGAELTKGSGKGMAVCSVTTCCATLLAADILVVSGLLVSVVRSVFTVLRLELAVSCALRNVVYVGLLGLLIYAK